MSNVIIKTHVYWCVTNSAPIFSITVPIMNTNIQTLSTLVRSDIVTQCPKTMHADNGIKSVKSSDSVKKLRMLHFLALEEKKIIKHEEQKDLCTIIDCYAPTA